MTDEQLREVFRNRFGTTPRLSSAPGRVNLIGEHTDYNDGLVLPAAIGFSTRVAFAPCDGEALLVCSQAFPEEPEVAIPLGVSGVKRGHWTDYVEGVLRVLEQAAGPVPGVALLVDSDVPLGAGLSSSAALEVAVAGALASVARMSLSPGRLAALCQRAENEFVGTRCGIMDQSIACLAHAGHALLLDCRSGESSHVPLPPSLEILLINTGVRHALADGEYNLRREQCERALRGLGRRDPAMQSLRDANLTVLQAVRNEIGDIPFRRARHVVTENARVRALVTALREEDSTAIREAMGASHESLRTDYDVSCPELDLLVELASAEPLVVGSRMTGGGFGGCTVNLVPAGRGTLISEAIATEYQKRTGRGAEAWVTPAAAGARVE